MFVFPLLESRRDDSNVGSDSARALQIACANELLSGRERGWLGGEVGVLPGGAGVEPLPERDDAVTAEDIIDKLLFVVRILKERDDVHALKNSWKKKDTRKNTLYAAAPKITIKDEKTLNEPLHRPLHKRSMKNSQILAVFKATTYHVSLHLWYWPLDARQAHGPLDRYACEPLDCYACEPLDR